MQSTLLALGFLFAFSMVLATPTSDKKITEEKPNDQLDTATKDINIGFTEAQKETVDEGLEYVSAAQVQNNNNKEVDNDRLKTTNTQEYSYTQNDEDTSVEDIADDMEGDQDEEEEGEEDLDPHAAPLDKRHKSNVVLGRGIGNFGDLMFQYATVSAVARSSKRRAIFSPSFTSFVQVFPKAPLVIIEDEEIVQLQPLTNITLNDSEVSFDSVRYDIPDDGSVEIVGQTKSWKYFHVLLNSLRIEFNPAEYYINAADEYLEEVMKRALKDKTKKYPGNEETVRTEENKTGELDENVDGGFLKYNSKKQETKKGESKERRSGKDDQPQPEQQTTQQPDEQPKSIIEQLKTPGDEITLIGVHIPALFINNGGEDKERDNQHDSNNDKDSAEEQKRKQKEEAVLTYLHNAMDYYRDEHSVSDDFVQFVVVCEDLKWCIDHLNGPGVHFAIGGSSELDLSILARCDHAILTSSSMSWWSAWLTGGQVVYPGTLYEINGVVLDNYVLPDWTEI